MRSLYLLVLLIAALLASGCIVYGKLPPFTEKDVADCIEKNDLDVCISKCEQTIVPSQVVFDDCYYWTVKQSVLKYGKNNQTLITKLKTVCEKIVSPGGFSPTKQNCYDLLETPE